MRHRRKQRVVHPDPCPNLDVERGTDGNGVGSWVPGDKHRFLCDYLDATRYAWQKWPKRAYLDPFAGPGRIQVEGESGTRDGSAVLAWREIEQTAPFTQMLIGDISEKRATACEARLKALGAPVKSFVGAASDTVPRMVREVAQGALTFAFLDPYNLEFLDFAIIKEIARLKVDLAVNFSTMDLQRNAELEFDPKRARFDNTAPGWRQDAKILSKSKRNTPLAFFEYWCELVRQLGFQNSREMPLVSGNRGQPLYRLVFFSSNPLPDRIWSDVARSPNRSLFSD